MNDKNGSNVTVIESDDYREEEQLLKQDPIVIAMAKECTNATDEVMRGHEFMGLANDEYRRRGGTQNKSIGGVARAIRSLVNDWSKDA